MQRTNRRSFTALAALLAGGLLFPACTNTNSGETDQAATASASGGGGSATQPSDSNADTQGSGFLTNLLPWHSDTVIRELPAGTTLRIALLQEVSSSGNGAGDVVSGQIAKDVVAGGQVVIPAGSRVSGTVVEAVPLKKIGGKAKLALSFTEVDPPDVEASSIQAAWSAEGKSETKKDAATIAGATAGGALLGRVIGHDKGDEAKGTLIGAIVGGGAGTAIAAGTKGQEVVLGSGEVINVVLDAPASIAVQG